jgi:hypothetical protein
MILSYLIFFLVNAVFLFLPPLWLLNRPKSWFNKPENQLIFLQLASPIIFILISRPLHLRYFFHLTPVLAILLAFQLHITFGKIEQARPSFHRLVPVIVTFIFVVSGLLTRPNLPELLLRKEIGTIELANYIRANTQPDQKVVSDYAGLNFFAERESIYEASIIAGAQIEGEIVTGESLIRQLEGNQVEMVIIHVDGGDPPPHQFVELVDFENFHTFINGHYYFSTIFDRAGQQL